MNEIKSLYGSRIKFVFRNFPLAIPAHDKAYDAAVAAEAAGLQGKSSAGFDQLFQVPLFIHRHDFVTHQIGCGIKTNGNMNVGVFA